MWQHIHEYTTNAIGFVPMLFQMLEEVNGAIFSQISMLLMTLWWRRNKKCWHAKFPTIFYVVS
jgi:hypothetical protein